MNDRQRKALKEEYGINYEKMVKALYEIRRFMERLPDLIEEIIKIQRETIKKIDTKKIEAIKEALEEGQRH